jgi:hypothetical protein
MRIGGEYCYVNKFYVDIIRYFLFKTTFSNINFIDEVSWENDGSFICYWQTVLYKVVSSTLHRGWEWTDDCCCLKASENFTVVGSEWAIVVV